MEVGLVGKGEGGGRRTYQNPIWLANPEAKRGATQKALTLFSAVVMPQKGLDETIGPSSFADTCIELT